MLWKKKRSFMMSGATIALLLTSGFIGSLLVQQTEVMRVWKTGTIIFSSPTRFGNHTLQQGEYKVYCERTDAGHQLVFIRLTERHPYYTSSTANETSDITKALCRVEQLDGEAKQTELRLAKDNSGLQYVKQALIRGENVLHIF